MSVEISPFRQASLLIKSKGITVRSDVLCKYTQLLLLPELYDLLTKEEKNSEGGCQILSVALNALSYLANRTPEDIKVIREYQWTPLLASIERLGDLIKNRPLEKDLYKICCTQLNQCRNI